MSHMFAIFIKIIIVVWHKNNFVSALFTLEKYLNMNALTFSEGVLYAHTHSSFSTETEKINTTLGQSLTDFATWEKQRVK